MTDTHSHNTTIERPDWLPLETWPYQIRTVSLDEVTLSYTDEGDGPLLLLVHDGLWSYVWGQLIGGMRSTFRVVTLDFPGAGLSLSDGATAGLRNDSALLERFVDHLGLSHVTLVVHDLGGPVGVGFAARRPDLIEGLVLVNTFAWPPHVRPLEVMFGVMSNPLVERLDVSTNLVPRLTSGRFGVGRHLDRKQRHAFLGPFRQKGPRRRLHQLMRAARGEHGYLAELEKALGEALVDKPALTIFGERNDPFGFQAKFADHLARVQESVIPGGNHFPMCDEPELVAEIVANWHRSRIAQ